VLRNITYNNPSVKEEIDRKVGSAFPFFTRLKMRGIGSKRMVIVESSADILKLTSYQNSIVYCYVELRPTGIIVHFRSILETIGWIVPFHHLSVFKNGNQFSLHAAGSFVKLGGLNDDAADEAFIRKMMRHKQDACGCSSLPED
jgi:hypothetical protein